MKLKERLLFDMKTAMKVQDKNSLSVIRMVRAVLLQTEKDQQRQLSDDDVLAIIAKEVKQRSDVIAEVGQVRPAYAQKLSSEIEILSKYLPQPFSQEEIEDLIAKTIFELQASGLKDIGKVMPVLMPVIRGRADTKMVSQMVREILLTREEV
ncbi:MAG: GatB/YqeY domain-containing protein [Firmicutes bacterium]|nr:GatB/YqeY domain-containing protein [Bacillota bacterium]